MVAQLAGRGGSMPNLRRRNFSRRNTSESSLAAEVDGRVWKFLRCDRTFSYEHVLTIASNAPWNKRATKRFNIAAGFNPRGSRFHRGFDNGEAEQ